MTTASVTAAPRRRNPRVAVQRFGSFLSGMVLPNIAAFIAWGLITAFFIATGWTPNGILGGFGNADVIGWQGAATALAQDATTHATFQQYVGLVGPMITYLLPLLIANTGGRMIYDQRGGVVATIATMGVIVGSNIPMFLGAMIVGPLAAWLMKQVDRIWDGKIRPGFEMLVNNFSAGILGALLAVGAFFGVAPLVEGFSNILKAGVEWLVNLHLLPLTSIFIEPGKVLFLNNAINHGILTPLGIEQADGPTHKSILFLLEANPGPGAGLLLAFIVFGTGIARTTAPGALLIQFIGGIHEIYFPYVLSKPILILATMAGGATGVLTNVIFNSGLRAPASPGSIIAILIQTASDSYVGVILSVIFSAGVSFLVAAIILRASRRRDLELADSGAFEAAVAQTQANKGKESSVLSGLAASAKSGQEQTIVFACDAGMGSSAMGAGVLRNKLKKAGVENVKVVNKAIANLDDSADLVITQRELTARAEQKAPNARHISVDNFLAAPEYDEVVGSFAGEKAGS
jgi:mannitol PTS system EIICBA or EIICB component